MTFWTLASAATERAFADWQITAATRDVANMSKDGMDITLQAPIDSADPFPFGAKITVYRNRSSSTALPASGLPPVNATGFSGGTIFFVGYSTHNRQRASAQEESFNYHFAGPWEFFMERTILQQLFFSYSAAVSANVAAYRSQFVLGLSLNTLVGTADTVAGSSSDQPPLDPPDDYSNRAILHRDHGHLDRLRQHAPISI